MVRLLLCMMGSKGGTSMQGRRGHHTRGAYPRQTTCVLGICGMPAAYAGLCEGRDALGTVSAVQAARHVPRSSRRATRTQGKPVAVSGRQHLLPASDTGNRHQWCSEGSPGDRGVACSLQRPMCTEGSGRHDGMCSPVAPSRTYALPCYCLDKEKSDGRAKDQPASC